MRVAMCVDMCMETVVKCKEDGGRGRLASSFERINDDVSYDHSNAV